MAELLDTLIIGAGDFGQAGKGGGTGVASAGWDTHSGRRIRVDPANPSLAFIEANNRLPSAGGNLHLSRGSSVYNFAAIATMTKPFKLSADRGAIIGKATNNRTCFNVTAKAHFDGLEFAAAIDASTPTAQSFVEVNGAGGASDAPECRFTDCTFKPLQNANNVEGFFAIRAIGAAGEQNRALHLERCQYVVRVGTGNAWAWVGEETSGQGTNEYDGTPYGCGLLNAKLYRHVHINHCDIMGEGDGVASQVMGVGILLEDCHYATIHDFKASSLSSAASSGTDHAAPIILVRGVTAEGFHLNATDIFAELLTAKHVIAGVTPRWLSVVQLEMGRGTLQASTVYTEAGGDTVRLIGIGSHNCNGPAASGHFLYDINGANNVQVIGAAATFRNDLNNPFRATNCANLKEIGLFHEAKRTA